MIIIIIITCNYNVCAMKKNEPSIFSKNLGLLKDHLQETKKIKGVVDMAEKLGTNRTASDGI